jgi:Kdo2-lipid IVA lauroyltransferase/acyltransferase
MWFFILLSRLPWWFCYKLSSFLAWLLRDVIQYRKAVVLDNLRRSFPDKSKIEIEQITKDFYLNLTDVTIETIKMLSMDSNALKARVKTENIIEIQKLIEKYGVAIIVTSHQCNWEWQGQMFHINVAPADAIYKPLSSLFFDNFMLQLRSKYGLYPFSMQQTIREIAKRRNIKRGIGLIADQVPFPQMAYWTTFLNQETGFFNGSEKIARSFQYPIVYADMQRTSRGYYTVVYEVLAIPPFDKQEDGSLVELYVHRLEKTIQEHPSDWLWSHKRWKHKKPVKSL